MSELTNRDHDRIRDDASSLVDRLADHTMLMAEARRLVIHQCSPAAQVFTAMADRLAERPLEPGDLESDWLALDL